MTARKTAVLLGALTLLSAAGLHAQGVGVTLTATPVTWEVAPNVTMSAWAYNGTVPGPILRYHQGDTVRVTLVNNLPEATTIHWHGIPVPNGMDGVPGISAPTVAPGSSFTYEFPAPPPGTYWYHPHADAAFQIASGLYGVLIVDPPVAAGKAWDDEVLVVIGDSGGGMMTGPGLPTATRGRMPGGMGNPGMMGSGGSSPAAMMASGLLINGKTGPSIPPVRVKRGDRVLFRFVNTGNMVHPMHIHGMAWTVTATDGFDLPAAARYKKDTLPINAGERYDAILLADNPGTWLVHCHNLMHVGESETGMTGLVFQLIVE
jgi:FtsP/CotA-like multicopper oxidase with cupredoxin domain